MAIQSYIEPYSLSSEAVYVACQGSPQSVCHCYRPTESGQLVGVWNVWAQVMNSIQAKRMTQAFERQLALGLYTEAYSKFTRPAHDANKTICQDNSRLAKSRKRDISIFRQDKASQAWKIQRKAKLIAVKAKARRVFVLLYKDKKTFDLHRKVT